MKKISKIALTAVAAVFLITCGCGSGEESAEIEIPILENSEVSYNTVKAEIGTISETYTLDGSMSNPYLVSVSSSVTSKITAVNVEDSQQVSEGDVLITLASDDIDKQIEDEQIRLDAAKQTYNTLCSTDGVSSYELQSAQLEIQIEQNQMDLLNSQKEEYSIKATTSGKISFSVDTESLSVGRQISSGTELFKISPDSGNVLCASTTTPDALTDVNFGTKVTVKHLSDEVATGTVSDIIYTDKGQDFSYYTYVISVPDLDSISYYDSFRVTFEAYTKDNVVLVPNEAIRTISDESYVDVLIDGVKVQTAVEVGIAGDSKTEIVSGLEGDEDIILS